MTSHSSRSSVPASPGQQQGSNKTMTMGDRLAKLGGADLDLLAKAQSSRSRFVQMGLVLLTTAGLAVVSMATALRYAFHLHLLLAGLAGLLWGFIIINLDRLLILTMRPQSGGWRHSLFFIVLPRMVMAMFLGAVVSTPLVLMIFEKEINVQIVKNQIENKNSLATEATSGKFGTELADVEKKIREANDVLKGNIPGLTSPSLEQARQTLKDAEGLLEQRKKESYALDGRWRCELAGSKCEGGSGKVGDGPLAQSLRKQLDEALAVQRKAQTAVNTAQAAVDQELELAKSSNAKVFEDAQAAARAALPKLTERQQELRTSIDGDLTKADTEVAQSDGILARINALFDLGDENRSAEVAHWAVFGLFFMIEILPVLAKAMTSFGPPTAYDRIADMSETDAVAEAMNQRKRSRRTLDDDNLKRKRIQDDMRAREERLGYKANAHVEKEMEKILDAALNQWSQNVQNTLAASPPHPAQSTSSSTQTPGAANAQPPSSRRAGGGSPADPSLGQPTRPSPNGQSGKRQAARSRFNLPTSGRTP